MAKAQSQGESVDTLSFEQAMQELEGIVNKLEQGSVDLEQSIAMYERGTALKTHCEKKLQAAQTRIEKIVSRAGGEVAAEPTDIE